MHNALKIGYITITLLLGLVAAKSDAFGIHRSDLIVQASSEQTGLSKKQAASRAKARFGGKVLSVSESSNKGTKLFKVKLLLDSGRIKIVTIKD